MSILGRIVGETATIIKVTTSKRLYGIFGMKANVSALVNVKPVLNAKTA